MTSRFQAQRDAHKWSWSIPMALVLLYPTLLSSAHAEGGSGRVAARVLLLAAAYLVPLSGLVLLWYSNRDTGPDAYLFRAKRIATLVVAVPPLYTLMGVVLYLMRIDGLDNAVWCAGWLAAGAAFAMSLSVSDSHESPRVPPPRLAHLRFLHGVVSLFILTVFLAPHIGNHLIGVMGTDAHRAVMRVLRRMYRTRVVEPAIISGFVFQVFSGLILLRYRTATKTDLFGLMQIATGTYLAAFIVAHVNSVFTLARYAGTETDYAWATGAPIGLVGDAWSIRLVPHYTLAVLFLLIHLGGGLRLVLLAHGVSRVRADRFSWFLNGLSCCATLVISIGLLGGRV
jgi:hypothetical protein